MLDELQEKISRWQVSPFLELCKGKGTNIGKYSGNADSRAETRALNYTLLLSVVNNIHILV